MNYTFNNSSIMSVNSGTIVLNVSGKTRTFVDAKLVSAVDGKIVLDLPSFKLTRGAYVVIHLHCCENKQRIFISDTDNSNWITYHVTQYEKGIKSEGTWGSNCILRNATPEEIEELNAQLAAEGKRWNPDTMQIEKLRWKPKLGDKYYFVNLSAVGLIIQHFTWKGDCIDNEIYNTNNCFKTREKAKAKLEQIKQILNQ